MSIRFASLLTLALATSLPALTPLPASAAAASPATSGLLPLRVDAQKGRIIATLPAPAADGVALRVLYTTALRTGLGSAPTFLDRGRIGETRLLAFRRIGNKLAIQFENPRFRPATPASGQDFAISTAWMGDIDQTAADGSFQVDLAGFLAADTLGVAQSLDQRGGNMGTGDGQGAGSGFHLDGKLSAADPATLKVFPDNIEVDALQTYVSSDPGEEVANIVPEPRQVSFTVHHSFVRLPPAGFVPRQFDPRIGGFATQVVDFGTPLGQDVVHDVANRFRLEKTDPAAARSKVVKPIVFYVDRAAPEPIRSALVEGIGWWKQAFEAAGYLDAFDVQVLPEGADPMDVRYNMVNWVDRATRGWSYGQEIVDPRTGEIVKGMVVLGSLRARQDIQIFQGLLGAEGTGRGGPQDPVQLALARLRQLGAHEVGHALGFAHNFAASTQDRASVMDYPAPRIGLVDGHLDLSDAYGRGVGAWDLRTADWLYGEPAPGQDRQQAADAKAAAAVAAGLRYVQDDNARSPDTAQPWGGLWDDGADPVAELQRMLQVRRVAIDGFGARMLAPGEPAANLRRRFVPIWLLHRYQLVSAAKSIGGVDFAYAVAGAENAAGTPVAPARQRQALDAVLATLDADALRVPARLVPLLSAARNGSDNRQFDIELFASAGGPVFDPLEAADAAASLSLSLLLAPSRLGRLSAQHALDPQALGVEELLDRVLATTVPAKADPLQRRIATRALLAIAQAARKPNLSPDVAGILDAKLHGAALALARRGGDASERDWAASLSRRLLDDPQALALLISQQARPAKLPPGDPIGEDDWFSDVL